MRWAADNLALAKFGAKELASPTAMAPYRTAEITLARKVKHSLTMTSQFSRHYIRLGEPKIMIFTFDVHRAKGIPMFKKNKK